MKMNRKEFLSAIGITGAAIAAGNYGDLGVLAQENGGNGNADLVAVLDGEPIVMLHKALEALGGIGRFVKKGQKIVVKPNIGWDQPPEVGANTNPELVGELIKLILAAGAAEVVVFDSTCDDWTKSYKNSGIEKAVKDAGGKLASGNPHDKGNFETVKLPLGKKLKEVQIHKALLACDTWFNVPVLKHHSGANMTIAMKNCMGLVSKESQKSFHLIDLQQCIADVCTYEKRPILNIIDAYRIMKTHGPKGHSVADSVLVKALIASTDIVAADTAAAKFAEQFIGKNLESVSHIAAGESHGLGTTQLDKLNVKKIQV
jgi:uncharacterized protein (DUF362 family)